MTAREILILELEGMHREAQREDRRKRADYHFLHLYQDRVGWLDAFIGEARLICANRNQLEHL